jgi:hypothetical protein
MNNEDVTTKRERYLYLPLSREVTETGGDTKDESVVAFQNIVRDDRVIGFRRRVHLG